MHIIEVPCKCSEFGHGEVCVMERYVADIRTLLEKYEGEAGMSERETPDDWPWPTYREAAINFKAIADELGQQVFDLQHTSELHLIDQLMLILNRAKGTYQGGEAP